MPVGQTGKGLPCAAAIQSRPGAMGLKGDECALDETLTVQHQVVMTFLQLAFEGGEFGPYRLVEGALAPAAEGYRKNPVHGRMPGGDGRETLFHHPVGAQAGDAGGGFGEGGEHVHHVAQGRPLHNQYAHGSRVSLRPPGAGC